MRIPIEFTRCGADAEFLNPVVGTAWTKVGTPAYAACKFGNGLTQSATATWRKLINFGIEMTVEFWWKPDHNSTANPNEWLINGWIDTYIEFQLYNGSIYPGLVVAGARKQQSKYTMPAYSSGDLIHVASTWMTTDTQKNRLFWNNSEISQDIEYYDLTWTAQTDMEIVCGGYGAPGIQDNIKIYDFKKTNFSDRENERGGMNDQIITT